MIAVSRMFRERVVITVFLCLIGVVACRHEPATRTSLFPSSNAVKGWVMTKDIRTFSADDLWKYIDGEAERYLKAGVRSVSTADYKFGDKFDAVVDTYTMADAAGAEKILQSEPAANAQPAQVGDSARMYSQSFVFRKGRYLVRITGYQESPEIQGALLQLARGIEPLLR